MRLKSIMAEGAGTALAAYLDQTMKTGSMKKAAASD